MPVMFPDYSGNARRAFSVCIITIHVSHRVSDHTFTLPRHVEMQIRCHLRFVQTIGSCCSTADPYHAQVQMQINVEKTVECEVDGVPTVELPSILKSEQMNIESEDPRSSGESQAV